ncbi:hypothetical protein EEL49_00645 [Muribaculaceae bacterium Isolate-104 (HZI)]|nr:hypothetical protein EEL49_00645 [Muribaculaceae bacterium Isolate-104 (HZI)]
MKLLVIPVVIALAATTSACTSKQMGESDKQETSEAMEYYDASSEAYPTSSYSDVKSYRDEVDELYDGVADETKAELRQACHEVGADYDELFNDADIDQQVEELKEETRQQLRELDF